MEEQTNSNSNQHFHPPRKRVRRSAAEVQRDFKCLFGPCQKAYGTKLALKIHMKNKHPFFYREYVQTSLKVSQNSSMLSIPDFMIVPISMIRIGDWKKASTSQGSLVARFLYKEGNICWEFISELSSVIRITTPLPEIDVIGIRKSTEEEKTQPNCLWVIIFQMKSRPTFQISQCGSLGTIEWLETSDCTSLQASVYKRHHLFLPDLNSIQMALYYFSIVDPTIKTRVKFAFKPVADFWKPVLPMIASSGTESPPKLNEVQILPKDTLNEVSTDDLISNDSLDGNIFFQEGEKHSTNQEKLDNLGRDFLLFWEFQN